MADPHRMPQLNAEVTSAVKKKLKLLERQLEHEDADGREIVAILIEAATAKDIRPDALKRYRARFNAEKRRRAKPKGPGGEPNA